LAAGKRDLDKAGPSGAMAAMKIHAKCAAVVVAAMAMPSLACAADLGFMSTRCDVAALALHRFVEGDGWKLDDPTHRVPWAYEDAEKDELLQWTDVDALAHSNELKPPLTADLMHRLLDEPEGGPLTNCQDYGALVSRLGGWRGPVARKLKFAMAHRHSPYQWPARHGRSVAFVAMSMPVLSADSDDALVYMSISCGSLCGEGVVWHFHRQTDRQWQFIDAIGLWVS
jgi:hypothetical protein